MNQTIKNEFSKLKNGVADIRIVCDDYLFFLRIKCVSYMPNHVLNRIKSNQFNLEITVEHILQSLGLLIRLLIKHTHTHWHHLALCSSLIGFSCTVWLIKIDKHEAEIINANHQFYVLSRYSCFVIIGFFTVSLSLGHC